MGRFLKCPVEIFEYGESLLLSFGDADHGRYSEFDIVVGSGPVLGLRCAAPCGPANACPRTSKFRRTGWRRCPGEFLRERQKDGEQFLHRGLLS